MIFIINGNESTSSEKQVPGRPGENRPERLLDVVLLFVAMRMCCVRGLARVLPGRDDAGRLSWSSSSRSLQYPVSSLRQAYGAALPALCTAIRPGRGVRHGRSVSHRCVVCAWSWHDLRTPRSFQACAGREQAPSGRSKVFPHNAARDDGLRGMSGESVPGIAPEASVRAA